MRVRLNTDPDSPDFGRLLPVLGSEQQRAMMLGRELNMWNTVRSSRAHLLPVVSTLSPAFQAAYLCGLAQIDKHRRELRVLLNEALDAVASC